jgi:hypothetical protein
MDNCKSCRQPIIKPEEAYTINKQNEKLCGSCAEKLLKNSEIKNPGRLKVKLLPNGLKKIVRTF